MECRIETNLLKKMVSKAVKGAGMNKMLPITNMMLLKGDSTGFYIVTTDGLNTFSVKNTEPVRNDFYMVLPVDTFSKLVAKMSCESITMEVEGNVLTLTGNGKYKIPLPNDEEGLLTFPEPKLEIPATSGKEIKASFVKAIINANKSALAKNLTVPCLCGYYLGEDEVISTDENVACFTTINLLGEPRLLSAVTLDLLALTNYENIFYEVCGNKLVFTSEDMQLVTEEIEGRDIYPVEPLTQLLESGNYSSYCKIPKLLLLSVLDRLSLFVEPYDKNAVVFKFTPDGLQVNSMKSSAVETISYIVSANFEPFSAFVDMIQLKSIINTFPSEDITIHYGAEGSLQLTCDNTTYIISLLTEV